PRHDLQQDDEQDPIPILGSCRSAAESDVLVKASLDCVGEAHDAPSIVFHAADSIKPRIGRKCSYGEWQITPEFPVDARFSMGASGAKLLRQQVVLVSDPTWDQEAIDEHPDDRNKPANDSEGQDELCDGDADAPQIKIMAAEPP